MDEPLSPADWYRYRLRAVNAEGSSPTLSLNGYTDNLYIPDVPGVDQAVKGCSVQVGDLAGVDQCIREELHTHDVHLATVRICETVNGQAMTCGTFVFTLPENPPQLPDENDPSVPPPPRNPDGSVWVPPSARGERPWRWGSAETEFPTRRGSWYRSCSPDGGRPFETLNWDSPHPVGKDDHWGWVDCDEKTWERYFDLTKYANAWTELL